MSPVLAIALLAATVVGGGVTISRVMTWSSSTARRHHLAARAHARAARHRATRRTT
jgi:hypothetical protein